MCANVYVSGVIVKLHKKLWMADVNLIPKYTDDCMYSYDWKGKNYVYASDVWHKYVGLGGGGGL